MIVRYQASKSDDESILALKSADHGLVIIVVDFGNFDAGWNDAFAVLAADGGDCVLASSQESFSHVPAAVAASLQTTNSIS